MLPRRRTFAIALVALAIATSGGHARAASLDTSFGNQGRVALDFGGAGSAVAGDLVVQPDGRIVAVGWIQNAFGLVRLLPNGSLDTTFGSGGVALLSFGSATRERTTPALAIDNAGRFVVAGSGYSLSGSDFALARIAANGTLDPSFGVGGKVITPVAPGGRDDLAEDVAVLPDGKIVAVGYANGTNGSDFAAVRYLSDGRLDTSFGVGGIAIVPTSPDSIADSASALALSRDGRITLAGATFRAVTGFDFAALQLDPTGLPDSSFGAGAWSFAPIAGDGWQEVITDAAALSSGDLLIGGLAFSPGFGPSRVAVARLLPDGAPDPAFGTGGQVVRALGSIQDTSAGLVQDGATTFVAVDSRGPEQDAAGQTVYTGRVGVMALDQAGRPDPAFADGGTLLFHVTSLGDDRIAAMAQRADGALVLLATVRSGSSTQDTLGFAVVAPHAVEPIPPPVETPSQRAKSRVAPASVIARPGRRRVVVLRGTASGPLGVDRVDIALVRLAGGAQAAKSKRRLCAYLRGPKPFFRTEPTRAGRCTRLTWLRAKGARSWRYQLRRALSAGSYVLYSRAAGSGLVERPGTGKAPKSNRVAFRVLG